METIKIEDVNKILENLNSYVLGKTFTMILEEESKDYWKEKDQGNVGEKITIYKLGIDDLHLKVVEECDSYGEKESIKSLRIVKPVLTQVTNFV